MFQETGGAGSHWDPVMMRGSIMMAELGEVSAQLRIIIIIENKAHTDGACCLLAIAGTTSLVPCHVVKSLQLIWRLGTWRFHLQVPYLQMSCSVIYT